MKKTNLTIGKGEGNLHRAETSGEGRRVSSGFGANEVIGDLSKSGCGRVVGTEPTVQWGEDVGGARQRGPKGCS